MKISLVQTEIEQAVKDYIHSQVDIKDGMEVSVDFQATRGADGFTCNIDIVAAAPKAPARGRQPKAASPAPSAPAANVTTANTGKTTKDAGSAGTATAGSTEPDPDSEQQDPDTTGGEEGSGSQDAQAEGNQQGGDGGSDEGQDGADTGAGQDAAEQAAQAVTETAAAPPAGAKKSLFSGLKRVQN